MQPPAFAPGFRLSTHDGFVLLAGLVTALALSSTEPIGAFVIGFVIAHFFLFCNVFRISRPAELVWALVFVACAGGTMAWGVPGWGTTVGVSVGVGVAVIALAMRQPSYHGVGWRWINPDLPDWWKSRTDEKLR